LVSGLATILFSAIRSALYAGTPCRKEHLRQCLADPHCRKRGQKQKDQIQAQRTFDRRTGELNGSLSGSARFTSLLPIMENTRFFTVKQRYWPQGVSVDFKMQAHRAGTARKFRILIGSFLK
jgi:hypothetical protein